ncbi:alpha/beta-hydrolase [Gonapodya prolifera JEL478]|uniref:Alpha/beta-hydrolase n=1 Tax=Gonapodya prolifera (strain JEL478) TaxID=1344416 RepID=A0A139AAU0_GONPJ|nr:alpha/beta-hydrolase [Gonapodya prolifera JEL478]|eukprot:KXS13585.1 alpha/beta-hydrolase [Gonapodya prolifera JEL478]
MDPLNPASFRHRRADVNGITYHYVEEGAENHRALILVHGFPDLWYGWRFQIKPLVEAGFRVIVPTMRGYGASTMELSKEFSPLSTRRKYALKNICMDLLELMDHLKIRTATFIGHDWGAAVVWRMGLHFPHVVEAICCINVAYTPPSDAHPTRDEVLKAAPQAAYQFYFCTDRAEDALNKNIELTMRVLLRSGGNKAERLTFNPFKNPLTFETVPEDLSPLSTMTPREYSYYVDTFTQSTFNGPLNWYRNRRFNFEDELGLDKVLKMPVFFIYGEKDPVFRPSSLPTMRQYIQNFSVKSVPNSGHWTQAEFPDQVNTFLLAWLRDLKPRETPMLWEKSPKL